MPTTRTRKGITGLGVSGAALLMVVTAACSGSPDSTPQSSPTTALAASHAPSRPTTSAAARPTAPSTTAPAATATTTPRPTVPATTAPPVTSTTAAPSSGGAFPTASSTGVTAGTSLVNWTGSMSSSAVPGSTEVVDGITYKVINGYSFNLATNDQYFSINDANVIIRNSRFTKAAVDSGQALVRTSNGARSLIIERSEFEAAFNRGVQSDTADITIRASRFHNTGEAAVEKNDRSAASSLTVTDSYMTNDKGWPSGQHVDGIQIGGARNVTITHNTILNQPYGGTNGNTGYVSNSALGLWAELGNVSGSVTVDGNLLAGGGYVIYVEQKSPYSWQGPVRITNNTFDTRYSSTAGVWGPLYPRGLPSNLTWSGNSFSDGRAISQSSAINDF